ncbi:MAG: hypothetical protein HOB63_00180 [Opitutae bacterium]|nr:hypothetical protein [Opitutae bacterium]
MFTFPIKRPSVQVAEYRPSHSPHPTISKATNIAASSFFILLSNTGGSSGQARVLEVSGRLRATLVSDYFAVLDGHAKIFRPLIVVPSSNPIPVHDFGYGTFLAVLVLV